MITREFSADSLQVKVYDSRRSMGREAGLEAIAYLKRLLAEKDEIYCIFAAAPSQNEFLETLASAEDVAWGRVHAVHMDEYVNLPADAPQGFGNFLRRAIFDRVPFASVDFIGTSDDTDATLARYDGILASHRMDIGFLGIGENGHIAFNDPHVADFNDPLRIKKVNLDSKCRQQQVNDGCFASLDQVPLYALTLTVPALFKADRIFCVVPAATKAEAVRNTVFGPVCEQCPASILRTHQNATLYLDPDSSAKI